MAKQQNKPQQQPQKKVEPKKEVVLTPLIPETLAKKIFIGFAVVLVLVMVTVSHQFGISGDENYHRMYGHHVLNFYTSLGKDNTAATNIGADSLMVYYGGFYDGTAAILSKVASSINEWNVRHFWNSIFGFTAMLCAALVAVEIAGWQAGLIALIFMAFSPRFFGESMNNPKDITMAAGYMFAYVFIIKFLKQLPRPSWKVAIGLGCSIGMAMGIRIGGLLLIPYTFLFYGLAMVDLYGWSTLFDFSKFKENVWPSFKLALTAAALGYGLSLVFWPYGLVSPIDHPLKTLGVAQHFGVGMRVLFEGKQMMCAEQNPVTGTYESLLPWNYLIKWLFISTPLFGLIGLAVSPTLLGWMKKEKKLLMLSFLYFSLAFPICYILYKKSVVYDTMRHIYFVYPSIIILSALAFNYWLNRLSKNGKYIVAGLLLVLVFLPARFMFANHPNEYVYFNELEGGIKEAQGNYETDYYNNSIKQCVDWVKQHEDLKPRNGKKVSLYSNGVMGLYFEGDTTVSSGYSSYRNRCNVDADYEIFYTRYVDRELLLHGCFPPEQTVYTVYADGVPLSCVIKKTDKSDYLGIEAMKHNDFETAVQLLEPYCQKYPKADVALMNLGLAYLQTARTDPSRVSKGINTLTACLNLNSENTNVIYYLSKAYEMTGNRVQAEYFENMLRQVQERQ